MRNPWLRRNPWMSMWMSGANVAVNALRAHAARNAAAMTAGGLEQMFRAWSPPVAKPAKPRRTRGRR